jgi:tRNA U34 5-carboxymethylaminomethyl modifying GTPase MnmE/TrmE
MGAKLCCLRVKQGYRQAQQSLPRVEESLPKVTVEENLPQVEESLPKVTVEENLPQVEEGLSHVEQNLSRAPNVQFRVLIIGRANSGKTSILQRVCDTTESPEIYRPGPEGIRERVGSLFQWHF